MCLSLLKPDNLEKGTARVPAAAVGCAVTLFTPCRRRRLATSASIDCQAPTNGVPLSDLP